MTKNLIILVACAVLTVISVRVLVISGIEITCTVLKLSSKTKGQIIGYATSMPEMVVVICSAWAGVFEAGFWNIASSNIINCILFGSAILFYRQVCDLKRLKFIDEIVFAMVSVALPLVLIGLAISLSRIVATCLIAFFFVYKIIDSKLDAQPVAETQENKSEDTENTNKSNPASAVKGIVYLFCGIVAVIVAGKFLGESAEALIAKLKIPALLVGWILGFITSIPEMTSFFEIYRLAKKGKTIHLTNDTQEALDALVASNMCNLSIILPIGAIIASF